MDKKQGICMAKLYTENDEELDCCPRFILQKAIDELANHGYEAKIGFEIEFTVLNKSDLKQPEMNAYSSLNSLMNFSDDIQNLYEALREQGIGFEIIHVESAGSRLEMVLKYGDPLTISSLPRWSSLTISLKKD